MAELSQRGGQVQYLNPPTLHTNPAFTQVVVTTGPAKTIYVGGQNAVDAAGNIVGAGDLAAQTRQIFTNVEAALDAAGAKLEHIVHWRLYIVQGQALEPGLAVFQQVWGRRPNPPAITGLFVAGLANPAFLAELDAVAVVPE